MNLLTLTSCLILVVTVSCRTPPPSRGCITVPSDECKTCMTDQLNDELSEAINGCTSSKPPCFLRCIALHLRQGSGTDIRVYEADLEGAYLECITAGTCQTPQQKG
ncbi:Uncharacterised protein g7107 [Pycnogonum litorale]